MSSLFSHIFIPLTILLIFSGKLRLDPKKIMVLSFFGILPDADAFIFTHRAFLHNVFVLIIPLLIFIFVKNKEIPGIISFYLVSHIILDIFNGGVFLLYPFYGSVFFSRIEVWFNNGDMLPIIYYGISDTIMPVGRGESMISSENVGTAILLTVVILLSTIKNRSKIENKN